MLKRHISVRLRLLCFLFILCASISLMRSGVSVSAADDTLGVHLYIDQYNAACDDPALMIDTSNLSAAALDHIDWLLSDGCMYTGIDADGNLCFESNDANVPSTLADFDDISGAGKVTQFTINYRLASGSSFNKTYYGYSNGTRMYCAENFTINYITFSHRFDSATFADISFCSFKQLDMMVEWYQYGTSNTNTLYDHGRLRFRNWERSSALFFDRDNTIIDTYDLYYDTSNGDLYTFLPRQSHALSELPVAVRCSQLYCDYALDGGYYYNFELPNNIKFTFADNYQQLVVDGLDDVSGSVDDLANQQAKEHEETKGLLGSIIDGITSIPGKIIELLTDALKSLFIPSDDFLNSKLKSFQDDLDNMGFLAWPVSASIDFLELLLNSSGSSGEITLPAAKFNMDGKTITIWEETTFNFAEIKTNVPVLFDTLNVLFGLLILVLVCQRAYNMWVKYFGQKPADVFSAIDIDDAGFSLEADRLDRQGYGL